MVITMIILSALKKAAKTNGAEGHTWKVEHNDSIYYVTDEMFSNEKFWKAVEVFEKNGMKIIFDTKEFGPGKIYLDKDDFAYAMKGDLEQRCGAINQWKSRETSIVEHSGPPPGLDMPYN